MHAGLLILATLTATTRLSKTKESAMNTAPLTETSGLIRALLVLTALAVGAALFWPYSKVTSVEPEAVQLERVVVQGKRMEPGTETLAQRRQARAMPA